MIYVCLYEDIFDGGRGRGGERRGVGGRAGGEQRGGEGRRGTEATRGENRGGGERRGEEGGGSGSVYILSFGFLVRWFVCLVLVYIGWYWYMMVFEG